MAGYDSCSKRHKNESAEEKMIHAVRLKYPKAFLAGLTISGKWMWCIEKEHGKTRLTGWHETPEEAWGEVYETIYGVVLT